MLIEPDSNAGEKNYVSKRQAELFRALRIPFAVLSALFCVATVFWMKSGQFNTVSFSLLTLKAIGVLISTMLIWYSLGADNPLLRSLCQLNSKTNCNNILQSKAAYIFGGISWSEMGLFYFGGGFIALCFDPTTVSEGFVSPLWGFGGASLLYTVYSVYHQAFVARKWCVLCLAVQTLFALEFTLGIWSKLPFILPHSTAAWAMFIIAFLAIPIGWALLKPSLVRSSQTDLLTRTVQRMKFNPHYLRALASQQRILPPIFDEMKSIHIGNSEAKNVLIPS